MTTKGKLEVKMLDELRAKPLRLRMKLSNNVLKGLREARGLSAKELAAKVGVSYATYVAVENLRRKPYHYSHKTLGIEWSSVVTKLSEYYGVLPEHLFPSDVLMVEKSEVETATSADDLGHLMLGAAPMDPEQYLAQKEVMGLYEKALDPDSRKGQRLLEAMTGRMDNATFEEIGKDLGGISRSRTQQIFRTARLRVIGAKVRVDRNENIPTFIVTEEHLLREQAKLESEALMGYEVGNGDFKRIVDVFKAALEHPKNIRQKLFGRVSADRTKKILDALWRIDVLRLDKDTGRWSRGKAQPMPKTYREDDMFKCISVWAELDNERVKQRVQSMRMQLNKRVVALEKGQP